MKKEITQIALFSLLSFTIISCNKPKDIKATCLPTNLQNGIIAFYPFSGGSINDYSGNNYNLINTTTASPATDRAGNTKCAFNFDAINKDFLKYTNPTFVDDFQSLPFSISVWYKNLKDKAFDYELLIGRDTTIHCPDTFGQWSLGLFDSRQPVLGINEYSLWWYNFAMQDTLWKHLVVTCKGTDLKLYLNGVLTSATSGTGCYTSFPTINAGDLFLGRYYTGLMDDVIIYNRILTAAEITQLYNLPACCQ